MTQVTFVVLACAAASSVVAAQPRVVPHVFADPAVFTFTDFVEHRVRAPLSSATIITGVDLLISALEGLVIAQHLDDDLLDRAHRLRRQAREVYRDRASPERIGERQDLFEELADLVEELNEELPREHRITETRIDALGRAADGIERDDPLPRQPDAVERFFRHAAEALRIARR